MSVVIFFLTSLVLIYRSISGQQAMMILAIATLFGWLLDKLSSFSFFLACVLLAAAALVIFPNPVRRQLLSKRLLDRIRALLPRLSETEAQALKSGSVDWDGQLFSGKPQWSQLLDAPLNTLSAEEQAFLDGPTDTLCAMLDDWRITREENDLPKPVWDYIRSEGFLGLMIPAEYGGKGFSHTAHSEIVTKIATRSGSAAVTVMVPNSLGPGELLLHYGTDEQKQRYLPRLAKGEELPCFALTSPVAGSDAAAIPDRGIVCMGDWHGEQVLGLRLTWNKRYITLAPVATLIGLAVKVYDPEGLLGQQAEIGTTCVLVPRDTPGVHAGARHLPMTAAFMNGPTWGKEVFIPMQQVIGGQEMLGKGWNMLLECLSIGRSISLPAMATATGKLASLGVGAYAYTREQFGSSISRFEGVQEALEPIAGYTYQMNAARLFTVGMLDRGLRPAVPSALLKYRNTNLMRTVINHAMDVAAGRAVISGPRNFLSQAYQAAPVAITVEGANILTRSLMVFGQGAIRCHPYISREIAAAEHSNHDLGAELLDEVIYAHAAHAVRNGLRSLVLAFAGGVLEDVPYRADLERYYRQIGRFSAVLALLTDTALLSIGGGLKARQRFSGRMADTLTELYYASAVIKHWHDQEYPTEQRPLVEWCLQRCLYDAQNALRDAVDNFPVAKLRRPLRWLCFPPLSTRLKAPDDALGALVAQSMVEDTPLREHLAAGCYRNEDPQDPVGRVLHAYRLAQETAPLREQLHRGIKTHGNPEAVAMLLGHQRAELVDWAVAEGIVGAEQRDALVAALEAIYEADLVDAFDARSLHKIADCSRGRLRLIEDRGDDPGARGSSAETHGEALAEHH